MSPQIVEHSGLGSEGLTACQQRGEQGAHSADKPGRGSGTWRRGWRLAAGARRRWRVVDGLRIKTERLEEWMGAETQASGGEGSSAEEVAAMVIDTTGHGAMPQESFITEASGAKSSHPSSSFSETERCVS